jgi:hypothetical protein
MSKELENQTGPEESKLSAHEEQQLLSKTADDEVEQQLYETDNASPKSPVMDFSMTELREHWAKDSDNCCSSCNVLLDQGTGGHVIEVDDEDHPGQKMLFGVYCHKCYQKLVGAGMYNILTGKTQPADVLDWHLQKTAEDHPKQKIFVLVQAIKNAVLARIGALIAVLKKTFK